MSTWTANKTAQPTAPTAFQHTSHQKVNALSPTICLCLCLLSNFQSRSLTLFLPRLGIDPDGTLFSLQPAHLGKSWTPNPRRVFDTCLLLVLHVNNFDSDLRHLRPLSSRHCSFCWPLRSFTPCPSSASRPLAIPLLTVDLH